MLSSITFTALAAALSLTFASAAPVTRLTVRDSTGPVIQDEYIVKLKDTAVTSVHIASLPFAFSVADADSPVTHSWADDFFRGYSGKFVGAALDAILSSPDVEYVEKNQIVRAATFIFDIYSPSSYSSPLLISKLMPLGTSKRSAPNPK